MTLIRNLNGFNIEFMNVILMFFYLWRNFFFFDVDLWWKIIKWSNLDLNFDFYWYILEVLLNILMFLTFWNIFEYILLREEENDGIIY